jgi:hypothetical protein
MCALKWSEQQKSADMSADLIATMSSSFQHEGRTLAARCSFEALLDKHPDISLPGSSTLVDVIAALAPGSGLDVEGKATILRALLTESRDPLLRRTLLQALVPGAVSTCRKLRFGSGIIDDPTDVLTMALSLLNDLIGDWAGQSRQYAGPDLLSALRGRLRRWLLTEKEAQRKVADVIDDDNTPAAPASRLLGRLESLSGGQHDRLARLTFARVFEGRTWDELSASEHASPETLQRQLRAFAMKYLVDC